VTDLDVISIGTMMGEISPARAGVTIGETDELLLAPSGSATNFVLALTRLGVRVGLISRVGDDDLGRWMVGALAGAGVDTSAVMAVPGQLSPLALASVDDAGAKTFAFYRFDGTCDPLASLGSNDVDDGYLARGAVFDLSEGALRSRRLRTTSLELAGRARGLGAAVCCAPNYRPGSWRRGEGEARGVLRDALRESDLAIMNAEEALLISGRGELGPAISWLAEAGPGVVVVTDGAEPVHVLDRGSLSTIPVSPVEVRYDIGAGDVFHAGFLAAWKPGCDAVECVPFAAAASAIKIARPPTIHNLPTRDEVTKRLRTVE